MSDTSDQAALPLAFTHAFTPTSSDDQTELWKALFEFQHLADPVKKDQTNPHLHSTYADLTTLWIAIRPLLKQCGLLVTQEPSPDRRGAIIVTTVVHVKSGQWMCNACYVPARKPDAQAFGSAITYARRYSLLTVLGLLTTDDDGHAASLPPPAAAAPAPVPKANSPGTDAEIEKARKGWEEWMKRQSLQMQGCDDEAALIKCWTGMQPELRNAPEDIKVALTALKDQQKNRHAEAKETGIDVDKDVPF